MTVSVSVLTDADRAWWLVARSRLFAGEPEDLLAEEVRQITSGTLRGGECAVLIARDADEPVGFAEIGVRSAAEGCLTSPVVYLEAWYVDDAARGKGVGRALVAAAEEWGREHGCREIASDALIENEESRRAHLALGFEELWAITCFRKAIEERQ